MTKKITDFYGNEYVDYSSYDNLRKIASLIDGQKNAMRKIIYTVIEQNTRTKVKVANLNSRMAEFADYLHGDACGVISNMAQKHVGTNNIPLLFASGNFGTRFEPQPSAPRYIYTYGTDDFFNLFKKVDCHVVKNQFFEGSKIEPMFYVPTLPILIINGSEGVSSGFAQKILPRNPREIKKYIVNKLTGKKSRVDLTPWYKGYNGTIEQGVHSSQWLIKGKVEKVGINRLLITEIPPNYSLNKYFEVLDSLEDKKIIQGYRDKSENDNFKFEITVPSKVLKKWSIDDCLTKLKLVQTITENYTALDENHKIFVGESLPDLLDEYVKVKLDYVQKRKDYLEPKLQNDIDVMNSKYEFIKLIVNDQLTINRRKKKHVENDLEVFTSIIKVNGNFDYLLNMSISSLTTERMMKLKESLTEVKLELSVLKKTSIKSLWESDINDL